MQEVHAPLPVGIVIRGHYIIEDLLSKVPSGAVYLVKDLRVKDAQHNLFVLKEVIDSHKQERYRFIFEGVALKQVRHQTLPRVYQLFNDGRHDRIYLLMDYIEGPNLETLRHQQPEQRYSLVEAISIMAPIINAVGYLHRQAPAIIHRDIKPTNIIVPRAEARAMLVDFGFREQYDLDSATPPSCSANYRAPELYSRGSDIRTDLYGLGATFYTLLTGIVPADGLFRMRQLDNGENDPLRPVEEVVPTIPAHVARAIYRAMSLHADNRFSSVERFWEAVWSLYDRPSTLSSSMPSASSPPPVISIDERAVEQVAVTSLQKQSRAKRVSLSRKLDIRIFLALLAHLWDALRPRRRQPASIAPRMLPTPSSPPVVSKQTVVHTSALEVAPAAPGSLPSISTRVPVTPENEQVESSASQLSVLAPDSDTPMMPTPKLPRARRSWKPGSFRSIVRKQGAEKPVSVLQKHRSSSTRSMAGKLHNTPAVILSRGKRQKARRPYFIACALILLLLSTVGSLFSLVEYQTYNAKYHADMSLAQEGVHHLQTSVALFATVQQNPLDASTVQKAQHEFTASLMIFSRLDSELKSLPGISQSLPTYGARLRAAFHLLPIAIEVSQTGVIACDTLDVLIARFHSPLNTRAPGLTKPDLNLINQNFQRIKTLLNLVIDQVNRLQPEDLQLDPRLTKLVTTFHKDISAVQSQLEVAEKVLPLVSTLLGIGTPTNYLIEVLDSTELRPGGGFIDGYGIATFSGGQLLTARITDVYSLDRPFETAGGQILFPASYRWFHLAPNWSFRDSNLDADFPTAARNAELTYRQEGGKVPIQGVIAITPAFIERALAITGPIVVPEYHETITGQNLVARIHYNELGPGKQVNQLQPKTFTETLAAHFLVRLRQLSPSDLLKLLQQMISSLHSKDVQIYLNSSAAENLIQSYHLDAAIQSPDSDSLFVVDANIGGNKTNSLLTNVLNDQVTIDGEGNAVHRTTLRYAWVLQGQIYGSSLYQDYLRVYAPPGSTLQAQGGWEPRGTSEAFGREVWAGLFTLSFGQTRTITLVWMVPDAAKKSTGGWDYQYTIQRQAGAQWMLHLQVTLPSCAQRITKLRGLLPSSPHTMTLNQSLNGDMDIGVDYTC